MSSRRRKLCALFGTLAITLSMTACQATTQSVTEVAESTSETEETASVLDSTDMFTDKDKEVGYDEDSAVTIELQDNESTAGSDSVDITDNVIRITEEGTYIISGTLSDGQIIVDADDAKVRLVLKDANITCKTSAAIYVLSADKVFITTADGTSNYVSTSGDFEAIDENNIDAAIYSKSDLTLNGEGSLEVSCASGHGIVSKDDLVITSGKYVVNALNHALSGKDSVRIAGGTYTLTAGKDGIHSENSDDEEKGFVYIETGSFNISCEGDGIDASNVVEILDGSFDIVAGGGADNGIVHREESFDFSKWSSEDGERPEMNEMPGGENKQGMMGRPGQGEMSDMGEKPEIDDENSKETTTEYSTAQSTDSSTKGIKADGGVYIYGGEFIINSADDSFHAGGTLEINGGNFEIASGDDGMHADEALVINAGTINVSESYEGIEGLTITLNGGEIEVVSSDDGLNAAGGADSSGFGGFQNDMFGSSEDVWIEINGGYLYVIASGDGVDSNGSLTINGGEVYIDGPSDSGNAAIDYGENAIASINGGIVVAVGSSGMLEGFDSSSAQGIMTVSVGSGSAGDVITLSDANGNELLSHTAAKAYDAVVISCPEIVEDETYSLHTGSNETTIEMTSLIYSSLTGGMHMK